MPKVLTILFVLLPTIATAQIRDPDTVAVYAIRDLPMIGWPYQLPLPAPRPVPEIRKGRLRYDSSAFGTSKVIISGEVLSFENDASRSRKYRTKTKITTADLKKAQERISLLTGYGSKPQPWHYRYQVCATHNPYMESRLQGLFDSFIWISYESGKSFLESLIKSGALNQGCAHAAFVDMYQGKDKKRYLLPVKYDIRRGRVDVEPMEAEEFITRDY